MNKSKVIKLFAWALVVLFVVASLVYYAKSYLNDYELSFTVEHKFILAMFAIAVLIMVALSSLILHKNYQLEKLIKLLIEDVANAEDNCIEFSRITQNMLMKFINKDGAD